MYHQQQQQHQPQPMPQQQPMLQHLQHQQHHQHQHTEWSNQYQSAWPGHSYHHAQGTSAPHAHRPPPPPPVHYPQPSHHPQSRMHSSGPHAPYYHGSTSSHSIHAGLSATPPTPHMPMCAPTLVSPSTPAAAAATKSPARSPRPLPSSANVKAITPVASNAENTERVAKATAAMATAGMMTTKPPRPYTEYTMFYQLEREYIIHRILATDEERTALNDDDDDVLSPGSVGSAGSQVALFENDPLMPARYRSLPLRADWYISGKTKKPTKRKHRKSHGKIGFLELTRMIASRWAQVDDETRKYCKMMAAMELVKYKEDMECYNLYKERLSAMGEIPEDMKERMLKKQRQAEKKEAIRAKEIDGAPRVIKADTVGSTTLAARNAAIKLEPLAHDSPIQKSYSTLDNDMERFISSLVDSPNRPAAAKVITPDRCSKRRNLFRDRPAIVSSTTTAALSTVYDDILVPLRDGNDDDNLDGIKMTFSGIDENEMAKEFSDHVRHGAPTGPMRVMATTSSAAQRAYEPSFDYWDELVENS